MSEGLVEWQDQQHNYWTGVEKRGPPWRSLEEGCSEQKPRQVSESWRKERTQRPASPSINRPRLFHAVVSLWCWHICRLREKIFMELGHEPRREGGEGGERKGMRHLDSNSGQRRSLCGQRKPPVTWCDGGGQKAKTGTGTWRPDSRWILLFLNIHPPNPGSFCINPRPLNLCSIGVYGRDPPHPIAPP